MGYQLHKPVVVPLDWTDNTGGAIEGQCFDMILLTDCIFSVYLATPIVATLLRHSSNRTEIWCCHEIRDVVRLKSNILIEFRVGLNHVILILLGRKSRICVTSEKPFCN